MSMPRLTLSIPQTASHAPLALVTHPTSSTLTYATSSAISSKTQIKLLLFSCTHKEAEPMAPFRFAMGRTSPQSKTPRELGRSADPSKPLVSIIGLLGLSLSPCDVCGAGEGSFLSCFDSLEDGLLNSRAVIPPPMEVNLEL